MKNFVFLILLILTGSAYGQQTIQSYNQIEAKDSFTLRGKTISEISTDTLLGNSDKKISTQKAVKINLDKKYDGMSKVASNIIVFKSPTRSDTLEITGNNTGGTGNVNSVNGIAPVNGNITLPLPDTSGLSGKADKTITIKINGVTKDLSANQDWGTISGGTGGGTTLNGTGFVKASGTTISYDNTSYISDSSALHQQLVNQLAAIQANASAITLKQSQLNGTGFVKASGTTISYDNTAYVSDTSALHQQLVNQLAAIQANASLITGKQNQLNGTGFVKMSGTTASYDNTVYVSDTSALHNNKVDKSTTIKINGVTKDLSGNQDWGTISGGGSIINVDSIIKTKTIASTITKIHDIQDSYGTLFAVNSISDILVNRLATKFGWSVLNTSLSGTSTNMMGFQLFKSRAQIATDTALFIMYGLNNVKGQGKTTGNFRNIENAYRLAIANNFLNSAVPVSDASVTKSGTWTTTSTWGTYGTKSAWLGGSSISSSTANNTVTFTTTGTNAVIGFIGTDSVTLAGGKFTISVDGVTGDQVNTNAQTDGVKQVADSFAYKGIPCVKVISGLATGSHTIVLTVNSGTVMFDFFGTMKTDASICAPVVISSLPKLPLQFWAGNFGVGDNNTIEQANTLIKKVIAEFKTINPLYPVYYIDNNKFIDPTSDFYTDNVHWLSTGHYKAFLNASDYLTNNAAYYAAMDIPSTNNDSSISGSPIKMYNATTKSYSTIINRSNGGVNLDGLQFITGNGTNNFYMNADGLFQASSANIPGTATAGGFVSTGSAPALFGRTNTTSQSRMQFQTASATDYYFGYRGGSNSVFYFDGAKAGTRYTFSGSGGTGLSGNSTVNGVLLTPDNTSALVSLESQSMGFMPSRMTTTQRNAINLTLGTLTNFNVTSAGVGCATAPTISFSGGTGTGATATMSVGSGSVNLSSLTFTGGSGYTTGDAVTVTFSGGGCTTQPTATVKVGQVGTMIYNTTTDTMDFWNGTTWKSLATL